MEEKTRRNKKILDEKTSGVTYRELVKKYNLSQVRIYQIIFRERMKLQNDNIQV